MILLRKWANENTSFDSTWTVWESYLLKPSFLPSWNYASKWQGCVLSLLLTGDGSRREKIESLEIKVLESGKALYGKRKVLPPSRAPSPSPSLASQRLSRHKDIVQPFSSQISTPCSVHLFVSYLSNQCYGVNFKIPAKRLSCEIQCVCDSVLSGKRSVVHVSSVQSIANTDTSAFSYMSLDKTVCLLNIKCRTNFFRCPRLWLWNDFMV